MASTLIVPVTNVKEIRPHNNADALEIAIIEGWQVVVPKGTFQVGSEVVYFPPDTVLPEDVSDDLGVTKYLSKGRVRQIKLRGEPSFGFAVSSEELGKRVPLGDYHSLAQDAANGIQNVAQYFGATKYEPPLRPQAGDALPDDARIPKFTDIENLRHYPELIPQGTPVAYSEKIHGTNSRVGWVEGEYFAGSHQLLRKMPDEDKLSSNLYWFPHTLDGIQGLINFFVNRDSKVITVFGEVYGSKVQNLSYGINNKLAYVMFAINVDGKYLNIGDVMTLGKFFGIPVVPFYEYNVPYDFASVQLIAEQDSLLAPGQMSEGIVVIPMQEMFDPKIGRVTLKYKANRFLFNDKVSDYTEQ
jgi:RNA ligase (TIGR02306 family)